MGWKICSVFHFDIFIREVIERWFSCFWICNIIHIRAECYFRIGKIKYIFLYSLGILPFYRVSRKRRQKYTRRWFRDNEKKCSNYCQCGLWKQNIKIRLFRSLLFLESLSGVHFLLFFALLFLCFDLILLSFMCFFCFSLSFSTIRVYFSLAYVVTIVFNVD